MLNNIGLRAKNIMNKIARQQQLQSKRIPNNIPGGPAKGKRESEFNQTALFVGAADEQAEHTTNMHPEYALEIAADHLAKDPAYYNDEINLANIQKGKQLKYKKDVFDNLKNNKQRKWN